MMIFKTEVPPIMEMVPSVIDSLLKEISRMAKQLNEEDAFKIRLILEEAITNGIKHGIKYDTGLKVQVLLSVEGQVLKISVKDEGGGFNPQKVADPVSEENLYKSSGRGIYLIRKNADEVEFNQAGNEIIITKKLGKG